MSGFRVQVWRRFGNKWWWCIISPNKPDGQGERLAVSLDCWAKLADAQRAASVVAQACGLQVEVEER